MRNGLDGQPTAVTVRRMDNDQGIGTRVRELRELRHFSQAHIAAVMTLKGHQWHQTTVAKTESGERPLRLSEAGALADSLFVPLTDLAGLERTAPDRAMAIAELRHVADQIEARLEELEG